MANPNFEPSQAMPNGLSLHQGNRQAQQVMSTASGLAPAAAAQQGMGMADAGRQAMAARDTALQQQVQSMNYSQAELAQSLQTAHALNAAAVHQLPMDNLKALAAMARG